MATTGRMPSRVALACALFIGCVLSAGAPRAQPANEIARHFRVEWEPEPVRRAGWAIEGFAHSTHEYRVGGVRLRVEILDAAGEIEARAYGYVQGDIPPRGRTYFPRGRTYFFIPLPQKGASYRVTVVAFSPIARGEP